MDINKDVKKIIKVIKNKINYIINFASQSMVAESYAQTRLVHTNVLGSINFVNNLSKIKILKNMSMYLRLKYMDQLK